MKKLLYAIQGTGNGHLSRAIEVYPYLKKYANVDVLISGIQSDINLDMPIKFNLYGLSFIFGKKGGVDFWKSIRSVKPCTLINDIRNIPVEQYDLVVNDFEPVTACACKFKKIPSVSLSHQASFYSDKTPRPNKKCKWSEWVLKHYAPTEHQMGLHFKSYDTNIFTPIIRKDIRSLKTSKNGFMIVYLPAYHHDVISEYLMKVKDIEWRIFSKYAVQRETKSNIQIFPISNSEWLDSLAKCDGALLGAGFESPSELLHLDKRVMVMPMKNQYEQQCNAISLEKMGVPVSHQMDNKFVEKLKSWVKGSWNLNYSFPDNTEELVQKLIKL